MTTVQQVGLSLSPLALGYGLKSHENNLFTYVLLGRNTIGSRLNTLFDLKQIPFDAMHVKPRRAFLKNDRHCRHPVTFMEGGGASHSTMYSNTFSEYFEIFLI